MTEARPRALHRLAQAYKVLGMRRIIWGIITGALGYGFTHNALAAAIAAVLGAVLVPSPAATHRVMVENIQTGEVKIQPMDGATQAYLNTRKNLSKGD